MQIRPGIISSCMAAEHIKKEGSFQNLLFTFFVRLLSAKLL